MTRTRRMMVRAGATHGAASIQLFSKQARYIVTKDSSIFGTKWLNQMASAQVERGSARSHLSIVCLGRLLHRLVYHTTPWATVHTNNI